MIRLFFLLGIVGLCARFRSFLKLCLSSFLTLRVMSNTLSYALLHVSCRCSPPPMVYAVACLHIFMVRCSHRYHPHTKGIPIYPPKHMITNLKLMSLLTCVAGCCWNDRNCRSRIGIGSSLLCDHHRPSWSFWLLWWLCASFCVRSDENKVRSVVRSLVRHHLPDIER